MQRLYTGYHLHALGLSLIFPSSPPLSVFPSLPLSVFPSLRLSLSPSLTQGVRTLPHNAPG